MGINAKIFQRMESLLGKEVSHEERMAGNKAISEEILKDNKYVNTRNDRIDKDGKVQGYSTKRVPDEEGKNQERSFTMQNLISYHDMMLGKGTSNLNKAVGYGVPGVAALGLAVASNNESNRGDALGAGILGSGAAVIGGALAMAGFGRVAEANIGKIARGVIDQSKNAKRTIDEHFPGVIDAAKDMFKDSVTNGEHSETLIQEKEAAARESQYKDDAKQAAYARREKASEAERLKSKAPIGTGTDTPASPVTPPVKAIPENVNIDNAASGTQVPYIPEVVEGEADLSRERVATDGPGIAGIEDPKNVLHKHKVTDQMNKGSSKKSRGM